VVNKETLAEIIEKMRMQGEIVNTIISSYVNAMMRSNQLPKVYMLLEKDNLIILFRAIATQYLRNQTQSKDILRLDVLEEVIYDKGLQNKKIVKIFIACTKEDTLYAYQTFVNLCNIVNKHDIKI